GEEAAAGEDATFDVSEPRTAERHQTRIAAGFFQRRAERLFDEALPRRLDGCELQVLLRAEMREQAALRHAEVVGQAADGQTFQSFHRCQVDGMVEDALFRALAFHAYAGRFLSRLLCVTRKPSD